MSNKKKPQPSEAQSEAEHKGVSDELSRQAIKDLAGYFDVLIQMDFAKQLKERKSDEEKRKEED